MTKLVGTKKKNRDSPKRNIIRKVKISRMQVAMIAPYSVIWVKNVAVLSAWNFGCQNCATQTVIEPTRQSTLKQFDVSVHEKLDNTIIKKSKHIS